MTRKAEGRGQRADANVQGLRPFSKIQESKV